MEPKASVSEKMFGQGKENKQTMNERQVPCPRCRQENPPRNRFCGSCGVPLTSGEQLATREEHRPVPPLAVPACAASALLKTFQGYEL